jgi:hypothetical protein
MTPEQKAERVAKMQAGRTAKKAASPVAAATAPAPAPVAAPAPAPVAVPAPVAAPTTPVAEKVESGADLEVEEVVVKGKAYLKSPEGFLFDIETQEPVGFLNEKGEIEEVEEA